MRSSIAAAFAALLLASPAHADEVFGGTYAHAVNTPLTLGGRGEQGFDGQLGYRWDKLGRTGLQPYVLVSANSAGDTHFAAAGVSYRYGGKIYIRPGLGIAIHTGSAGNFELPGNEQIEFGSRVLFEPELGIGVQLSERASIEAHLTHLSHAQIFGKQNPGMDAIGVRLNWRL